MEAHDTTINEILAKIDAIESAPEGSTEGLNFCEIYRGQLRFVLNAAILALGIFRPSLAEALKRVRSFLDEQCPA